MSATIRIKIMGGTHIEDAYYDCKRVSDSLGGIAVETRFNGVEMFFHGQLLKEWINDFHNRVYGAAKGGAMNYAHIVEPVDEALAAPPRNCDVGTAEEQYDRFIMFCRQYKRCNRCQFAKLSDVRCGRTVHVCALAWAQMPYEEGGAE